ncbi:4-hydroxythreonine-4-phosphate dehydrogenase PdxA [Gloeothece verrucosa]|uniref:4-hydroxythreonine-4-phosphate dehydrogenase n=1 Tax=Gloeothece verrucosa (strain PCC 7822) TaxID=497965 RepID=E0UJK2_GLOV7|nr:4-hydroxythreonine-4-phosphate dehydrogenase PdxA [Gloeothece verrucosa]ADN12246.1 4-hydroxythreonine-4-phosphate dehydrogenase [Gloeothece verrucosa PCC 7822]
MKSLHLAVTLGDPAGIGPEVVLKALADPSVAENYQITVVGSRALLISTYERLRSLSHLKPEDLAEPDSLSILDLPLEKTLLSQIRLGEGNAASGEASFAYLNAALAGTLNAQFDAIVTAPIAKYCWKAAGYDYPGQTEVLAQAAGVDKYGMLFVARSPYTGWVLRTLLATTHIPLSEVPRVLNPELMTRKLDLLVECLRTDFGLSEPKIVIAGLNPHSGEGGQLGTEEKEWLIAWLEAEKIQRREVKLVGPVPPDTMWVTPGQAWYTQGVNAAAADGYLALYHDQGLIPVKLMAFDQAINTTIGLPFVRTSPDHGTAFDIAGLGVAKAASMIEAIKLAATVTFSRLRPAVRSGLPNLTIRHF